MNEYIRPKEVLKLFNITRKTLYRWTLAGKLEYITDPQTGYHRYNKSYIMQVLNPTTKKKICYARVSSRGQKEDLERQVQLFELQYPTHTILIDYGSGLNFKRRELVTLIEDIMSGNIEEIVITHRDRLCRFGFDLFELMVQKYGGKITVLNNEVTSPERELVNDVLSIITCFSARLYGLRSHGVKRAIKESMSGKDNTDIQGGIDTTQDESLISV